MEFVKAKTILSKVNYGNEWYGIDYNMNLYRGCPHKCNKRTNLFMFIILMRKINGYIKDNKKIVLEEYQLIKKKYMIA